MSISKLPIFIRAGRLTIKVISVARRDLFFLKMWKILAIRNDLMIVICGPISLFYEELIMIPTKVMKTMAISNVFQVSLKNLNP